MISLRTLILSFSNRLYGAREDKEIFRAQEVLFTNLKLDRQLGVARLNEVCKKKFGKNYDEHNGMWSEHLVFFASLSLSTNPVSRILEIGTFKGEATSILSDLFPDSQIISVDLNHEAIRENSTYSYALSDIKAFASAPNLKNVEFLEMNSVKLVEYSEKFDLIWVDGYHLSPTVIMDITNAVRLLRKGGIALCDDVYLRSSWIEIDSDLSSKMALEELASTKLISLSYVYKRIGKKFNNFAVGSKRLGVAIKN